MTNPGSINAQGANPGGQTTPLPPGSMPINQPSPPKPGTSGFSSSPQGALHNPGIHSPVTPGPLKTFIYSPQVRIVIEHLGIQYDVSADVIRCQLQRPENSAATLFFTLHNKGLRYTPPGAMPFFFRMDRVVVYMKKTSWLQVFAGYLDKVPYKQLYAGEVRFKATCTIKRLMHTWWDPALPQSQSLLNQIAAPISVDSGMGTVLYNLLINVGGWNILNVHIQNFPTSFLQFIMGQIASLQTTNVPNVLQFNQMLFGSDTTPGPGAYAGGNANAGIPGPSIPGAGVAGTTFYMTQIVAACDSHGMGPQPLDNNVSAGLVQAGVTGEASSDHATQKAFQQVQNLAQSWQNTNRNSDGAILGVAAAMVQTGGGTTIRNLFNPSVPGSETFPNDGPAVTGGSGCGIFGMSDQGWGNIPERMNPLQAANMFFAALNNISGWRNMDPGQAIQQTLQANNASVAAFDAAVTLATTIVQGYRTSGAANVSTVMPAGTVTGSSVPGQAVGGSGGAPSGTPAALASGASTMPSPAAATSMVNPLSATKPVPDSEGAINFMRTCINLPYIWGGTGPGGYDCSGLMQAGFRAIGVAIPRNTQQIAAQVRRIPNYAAQRGDLVEPNGGHVVMWLGDGSIIEAQQSGVPIHQIPAYFNIASVFGVFRVCANGGPDPSAPFNPPAVMGPGVPPGALNQTGALGSTGSNGGAGGGGAASNLASYIFTPGAFSSNTAGLFTGTKAFIEGQPLIQMIKTVCAASLRSWSSAPNGDFMAWYPDYWGFDGKPSVMLLADIEMKDCTIDLSDDPLTTHVYVNGDLTMTGSIQDPVLGWLMTAGVATVEQPWLYARLLVAAPGDIEVDSGQEIMQRFGIRPLQQQFAMAGTQEMEFLLACQIFMEQWAKQYQTTISMTFMPELFPGMRVQLVSQSLQVYISAVSHVADYEQGFYTQVTIAAPSSPQAAQDMGTVQTPTITPQSVATTTTLINPLLAGSGV